MSQNYKQYSLDLVEVIRILCRRWKAVLGFSLIAGIIAFVITIFVPPLYEGYTSFIIKSPLVIDRNQLYRSEGAFQNKDFFASEDDIDQVLSIAKSDAVISQIMGKFDLWHVYGLSDSAKVFAKAKKRFKVMRHDTRYVAISFRDADARRAADIANFAKDEIERRYMGFFTETNQSIIRSIRMDIKAIDSTLQGMKSVRDADYVSNMEASIMAQSLMKDKANMQSLISQYSIGSNGAPIHMFYMLQEAGMDKQQSFPNRLLIIAGSVVAAFIFICILLVLQTAVRQRNLEYAA